MANRHSEKCANGRVPRRKSTEGGGLPHVGESDGLITDRCRSQHPHGPGHTPDLVGDALWQACEDPGIKLLGRICAHADRREIRGHRFARALDDFLEDVWKILRM